MSNKNPIGVFDSGYGGLSILKALQQHLPTQPFIYLGDHQNAPYGSRSKDELYDLTTRNIDWLFHQGCELVILACNTASSVLRRIQHEALPSHHPGKRVLGIVIPTIEKITGVAWNLPALSENLVSKSTIGVFATAATVQSQVYPLEIHKRAPHIRVVQQACPSLTSLIENGAPTKVIMHDVRMYVEELHAQMNGSLPDYILLGCTHYALIKDLFRAALGENVKLINQAECVVTSFENYLERHPIYRSNVTPLSPHLFTTGNADLVNKNGHYFLFNNARFTTIKI